MHRSSSLRTQTSKLRSKGLLWQKCGIPDKYAAANRFYVAGKSPEKLPRRYADRLAALSIGRGSDAKSEVGPLMDKDGQTKVSTLSEDSAEPRQAAAVCGGSAIVGPGYFYEPTVLANVPASTALLEKKCSGPSLRSSLSGTLIGTFFPIPRPCLRA